MANRLINLSITVIGLLTLGGVLAEGTRSVDKSTIADYWKKIRAAYLLMELTASNTIRGLDRS